MQQILGVFFMVGMGTIANVLAIVVGGYIGLLTKGGLKQSVQDSVIRSLGLATLFIGAGGALCGCWWSLTEDCPPSAPGTLCL